MLDVTTCSGVDPSGKEDSTQGINRAIVQARDMRPAKTLFFPPGVYLVSGTLLGGMNLRGHDGNGKVVLVGSTRGGKRPLIRLQDKSPGFSDASTPKPVVQIKVDAGDNSGPSWGFRNGFRGIDIDLGESNPGAVGIDFDAAQDSFLEDVRIQARDGFAGLTAIPGRNATTANVEVDGGQYGFYLARNAGSLGSTMVGVRCRDQRVMAMVLRIMRGSGVAGFEIKARKGPVIELRGAMPEEGSTPFFHGSVQLEDGGPVFSNPNRRVLAGTDLHVQGTNQLVSGMELPAKEGRWTLVRRFAWSPETVGTQRRSGTAVPGWNLVEGKQTREAYLEAEVMDGEPGDIPARHLWSSTPSFEDEDAAVAAPPDDKADYAEYLQNLINQHRKVYLPAGVYPISKPLFLPAHHKLLGVPGLRTHLKPAGWKPEAHTWVIDTEDDPESTSVLMDIGMDTPDADFIGGVRWRAGRHSIVRRVRAYFAAGRGRTRLRNYLVEGSGGGRWYGLADHAQLYASAAEDHPEYRKVYVRGTTEPLIFYGLNLERGGSQRGQPQNNAFLTIEDAANVTVVSTKTETEGSLVSLLRSRNVMLMGQVAIDTGSSHKHPYSFFSIRESQDIAILSAFWYGTEGQSLVEDDFEGETVERDSYLGLYLRGAPRAVVP
jgi:hypothetical protein